MGKVGEVVSQGLDGVPLGLTLQAMQLGWVVRHVDGGHGTVCCTREWGTEVLVEWDDLSRTWEYARDLQVLN